MKTALVTGAASGLGKGVAERLAKEGWSLVLWDLDEAGLAETAARCAPARCEVRKVDLASEGEVDAGLDALADAHLPSFILHAAGVLHVGSLDLLSAAACKRDIDINYLGTVHLLLAAARRMAPGGRIICISSIAGLKGLPEFAGYCASKFAVYGFCEAVHGDFKQRGIDLSVLCPPAVDTPMVQNLEGRPTLYDLFPFAEKEQVVARIVKAIAQRDAFLILVDAQSKLFYRVNGLMPRVTAGVVERLVKWKRAKAPR